MGAPIRAVVAASIAAEVGLEPGDVLLQINEQPIADILDYQFYSQEEQVILKVKKAGGEYWDVDIEKDFDEELGLVFEEVVFDRIKVCGNRCVFCFVDQLPARMRDTLYVKDDDYRYSFLFGNFITLTNLKESDWQKIETMRLSPLYVSVHTTSGKLRAQMMNNPQAAAINEHLSRLKRAGIEVHTQIVLCPGINDQAELERTIDDLRGYYPSVVSVGIVPVGLTGHREKLPAIQSVSAAQAAALIERANTWQEECRHKLGRGFVYLADEFYVKAARPIPPDDYYDDYSQIENGIGLIRFLLEDFDQEGKDLPQAVAPTEAHLVTGRSAAPVMEQIAAQLNRIQGLSVQVVAVDNRYFGGGVSVTGLLTGSDIIKRLGNDFAGKRVVLPEIIFREGTSLLLDDVSLPEIQARSGADIRTADGSVRSLLDAILA